MHGMQPLLRRSVATFSTVTVSAFVLRKDEATVLSASLVEMASSCVALVGGVVGLEVAKLEAVVRVCAFMRAAYRDGGGGLARHAYRELDDDTGSGGGGLHRFQRHGHHVGHLGYIGSQAGLHRVAGWDT